jgi:NAD(P)H-flavin reductase
MQYGWLGAGSWTTDAGYTSSEFVYFLFATYLFPVAIIFLISFASASFILLPQTSTLKLSIYYLLLTLSVLAVAYSYILSQDVLHCISYLCVSSVSDSAPADDDGGEGTLRAGQIFIGMLYFFTAVFFVIVFTTSIVIAHMQLSSSTEDKAKEALEADLLQDPLHPLFPASLLLSSSSSSSSSCPSELREEEREAETSPLLEDEKQKLKQKQGEVVGMEVVGTAPVSLKPSTYSPSVRPHALWAAVLLLVFYPFLVLACCALPTWWASFTRSGIQAYQQDVPSQTVGSYWSLSIGNGALVLKLFPDVVMYYGLIYLVAATTLLAKALPGLARLLHVKPLPSLSPHLSVGEAVLGLLVVGLLVGVFVWFYLFHGWEQSDVSSRSNYERAARSMGQVANVVAGLLVLPVTRSSAWTWLLSLSREAVLVYHQILGYLLLLVVGTHMLLWWLVFSEQNTFPHDILAVPLEYHADNFTVPLAQLTFLLMLLVFGVLTFYTIRRSHYKLFYYFHLFSTVVFLVMLWHATMSWYFLLGGLVLWVADWYLRLASQAATRVSVRRLAVCCPAPASSLHVLAGAGVGAGGANPGAGAVLELRYQPRSVFASTGKGEEEGLLSCPHPGQIMYINVPAVALHDWHPFSLSSSPCSGGGELSHHIRVVGASSSWTSRLLALSMASGGAGVAVNVEGPYGVSWDSHSGPGCLYSSFSGVLFLSGGIGITPLISAFRQLRLCPEAAAAMQGTAVRFVWVVRSEAEAEVFAQELLGLALDGLFTVQIYVTSLPSSSSSSAGADKDGGRHNLRPFVAGRPDLASLLASLPVQGPPPLSRRGRLVHACGPASLVCEIAGLCASAQDVVLKKEVFEL